MRAEYTYLALGSALFVVILEWAWLKTGLFRSRQYWIAMAIVAFFQVVTDGWLTKASNPIVIYDDHFNSGVRFPFDIPVEDFFFGFAMVTLAIALWIKADRMTARGVKADSASNGPTNS